jgi:hypothetical protein
MAQASSAIDIPAPLDQAWQLIGGFGSLPYWWPYIAKSEQSEGGRVRCLANPGGDTMVERLVAFDHAARSYSYSILHAQFSVTDYEATLRVRETNGGTGSRVECSGRFTPKGVIDQEACLLFQGIYEDSLKALAARFAPKKK